MTDDPSWWQAALGYMRFILPGAVGAGAAKWFMRHKPGDIEVCTTRIVRDGCGLPWNEQIAIHPLEDGRIEMKALRPDECQD